MINTQDHTQTALKIGQIVYCERDGSYEAGRVIRLSQSKVTPGQWIAAVQRFDDYTPGRWTMTGPVDSFKTECPDDDDAPDLQAAIDQIRALVRDRAESDILARKVWNICRGVS